MRDSIRRGSSAMRPSRKSKHQNLASSTLPIPPSMKYPGTIPWGVEYPSTQVQTYRNCGFSQHHFSAVKQANRKIADPSRTCSQSTAPKALLPLAPLSPPFSCPWPAPAPTPKLLQCYLAKQEHANWSSKEPPPASPKSSPSPGSLPVPFTNLQFHFNQAPVLSLPASRLLSLTRFRRKLPLFLGTGSLAASIIPFIRSQSLRINQNGDPIYHHAWQPCRFRQHHVAD